MTDESKRETWKKKEAFMTNPKVRMAEAKTLMERKEMLKAQSVIVVFDKYLLARQYHSHFSVNLSIPLSKSEVMERMATAFPELNLLEES
jgi:hypothetical protein